MIFLRHSANTNLKIIKNTHFFPAKTKEKDRNRDEKTGFRAFEIWALTTKTFVERAVAYNNWLLITK
jgi:hypothetical protein